MELKGRDCLQAAAPIPADIADAVLQRTPLGALLDVARNMFPDNVAAAAVNMNILGVITFSLFFGLCLSMVGDEAEPMIKLVDVSLLSLLRLGVIALKELFDAWLAILSFCLLPA